MSIGNLRSAIGNPSVAVRLFLTCWLVYVLHFATNIVREIYPALALGDHWSVDVSEYAGLHPDLFELPGHGTFINNNPGASILGALPYGVARPLIDRIVARVQRQRAAHPGREPARYDSPWPMAREFYAQARARGLDVKFALAAAVMQAGVMAPLSALAAVVMYAVLASLTGSSRAACWLAVLYAFATPVFYRTAQLNQNLLVAHCAFFAFVLLWRPWAEAQPPRWPQTLAAGLLSGWAVVCDYSGLVVLLVLGGYAVITRRRAASGSAALWFSVGAVLSLSVLLAYQWFCFGSPWYPAQHYMAPKRYTHMGYAGMDWPHLDLLWATAFDPRFGLFVSAPLLLLALYPPAWSHRLRLTRRRETWCIAALTAAMFVFCSANQYGRMQFNSGVRHVVPVAPFLFLITAGVLRRLPAAGAVVIGVLATYWSWCLAMYRDVERGRGVVESLLHITRDGPQLPWLTTLERMRFVPGGVWTVPLLALAALSVCALWRVPLRRVLIVAGGFMVAAALWTSNAAIVQALVSDPSRSLAWGPTLFRVLLAAHGAAVALIGIAWSRPGRALPPAAEAAPPAAGSSAPWLVLVGLSLLALALRLYRLDTGLWVDEVTTLLDFVRPPLGDILTSFPSQNQHMLYSLLAHCCVRLWGESAWALRLPSVVFGVASLWALFLLGRRLVGDRDALLACALATVSYHHIWFSQNARGYMALLFFTTLSTWLWLEAEERNAWRWWLGYVGAMVLGLWVHMTMVFVVAAHVLIHVGSLLTRAGEPRRPQAKPFLAWCLCGTLTLQLYALALPEFLHTALHQESLPSEWTSLWWVLRESLRSLQIGFVTVVAVVGGAAVAGVGWLSILRRTPAAALAMLLPALLGGLCMWTLAHNLWPRFFFFSMGFALLIVVHGARRVAAWCAGSRAERAGSALVGALIVACIVTLPRCYRPKQDFAGARDFVEQQRAPGDAVVAVGLAGPMYTRYFAPHWLAAQTAGELAAIRRAHPRVWLVYTLPIQVKTYRPEIWATIDKACEIVKVFPGTLGGGEVTVCRLRAASADKS